MDKKSIFLLIFGLVASFVVAYSQISMQNIAAVKVDNLSEAQIQDFVTSYTNAGYSFAEVEALGRSKGMPASEIEKLRARIQVSTQNLSSAVEVTSREVQNKIAETVQQESLEEQQNIKNVNKLFGSDLFNNSKLTFEPILNIPTPKNYQIGAGDELLVDVFGLSENTMKLTVSPEGYVRIPNVGQVQVSGRTMDEATKVIKSQLSTIYSSINTGATTVTVTLGNIRSVKVYIVGEAALPGTYTLSSLSTVFNALYSCGGPAQNGSMRNIKVLRENKEIAIVDLYGFLLYGKLENNVTLQDQDVIQIPPYEDRVIMDGAVKRIGIYEMKKGETLDDLIKFSGGFTEDAYKARIAVVRNTDEEKSVADVPEELYKMFYPQSGDKFTVGTLLDKYTNRVQITGNVFRPGVYALEEGMTLKDLVTKAAGLREDAFMQLATVTRLREDLTPEIISFSVRDFVEGRFNLELKKEDIITIGTKGDFEEDKFVYIEGQVMEPGSFPFYEGMMLKDLIFLSKGFREFAETDKIEVIRRLTNSDLIEENSQNAEVLIMSLDRNLDGADGDFLLKPRDQVSVRLKENFETIKSVQLLGEVRSPGSYAITSKKEKISDILTRSGGLSQYAYPKGAFLLRNSSRSKAEQMRDLKLIAALNEVSDSTATAELQQAFMSRNDLVGIHLDEIIKNQGEDTDLFVEEGDIIFVPKRLQTVTVGGAVQVVGMIPYQTHSYRKYIDQSGDYARFADKKNGYVAYPNGTIASTKKFLFFKSYPAVEPGSHIFVPEKPERKDAKETVAFTTSILGSLVSIASVVVSVIILSQK